MACNDKCVNYKIRGRRIPLSDTVGFCSKCDKLLEWVGVWCPCCNIKLRRRPRNNKSSRIAREIRLEGV